MWPLGVLLLWALVCAARGNVLEKIFTWPGSDLLLPIRRHLTLNHKDGSCDEFEWKYKDPSGHNETRIARHKWCKLTTDNRHITNTRISENGSLIIDDVTLDNDGIYRVEIHNSRGDIIQRGDYIIRVEGNVQEEIFTRPGSDLLLPIRRHLTLNHEDGTCDEFEWKYKDPSSRHNGIRIARHRGCNLATDNRHITNTRISENGSLIIDDVTLHNEGIYRVDIYNSTGHHIQTDHYIIHVEVPLSDIEVTSSCLPDGSAKADCSVNGSDPRYSWSLDGRSVSNESWVTLPPPASGTLRCDVTNQINNLSTSININCPGGLEVYNVTSSERSVHVTVPPVSPPDSWNISCLVKNNISERSTDQIHESCVGNVQEEIFTQPGSDLLLSIRLHLTLNLKDGTCDEFKWTYKDPSRDYELIIARHRGCKLTTYNQLFTNTRISENGSLIIDDVTLDTDGIYRVEIHNSRGDHIQTDHYIIHVEVPVSVPVLNVSCLQDGRAEISCRVEEGIKLNISVSVIGGYQRNYSVSSNNITAIVGSPGPWSITCYVENHVSQEMSRAEVTCPEIRSHWGHLLSHGVVFVLNTVLIIYLINELMKMKRNQRNQERERRTKRRDP